MMPLLSGPELARAAHTARLAHMSLADWLQERGLARAELETALAEHFACPFFTFDDDTRLPEAVRASVRPEFFTRIVAVPVASPGPELTVVMADPRDLAALDQLQAMAPHQRLAVHVGLAGEITDFIERAYGLHPDARTMVQHLSEGQLLEEDDGDRDEAASVGDADSAVIKLVNQLITEAIGRGASDIHVEPNGRSQPMRVRLRIDGDCLDFQDVPARFRRAVVARIKIMARLDISERRKPQDGKIRFHLAGHTVELRVATYPTASGDEDVVLRILPDGKPVPLADMLLSPANLAALRELIHKPYGLVLCVGPTGSGKTTTLHSALAEINRADLKICTAEDPVEITQAGLRQVQVKPRIGLTFATALRSFLRADPDVIMIGEMRDHETSQTAIDASLTGHLVLSTLHTNTAVETITRLVNMGVDPFTFADSLLGVLAQRLTARLCPECKTRAAPGGVEQQHLDQVLASVHRAPSSEPPFVPHGCELCHGKGYRGRMALHELLVVDDTLRAAIGARAPVEELRRLAAATSMHTLLKDGLDKVAQGLTDLTQVLAVCSR